MNDKTEDVIEKLIKYWEEKKGIELDEDELKVIKSVAYQMVDESIERQVTSAKEIKERSQRFKGLDIE